MLYARNMLTLKGPSYRIRSLFSISALNSKNWTVSHACTWDNFKGTKSQTASEKPLHLKITSAIASNEKLHHLFTLAKEMIILDPFLAECLFLYKCKETAPYMCTILSINDTHGHVYVCPNCVKKTLSHARTYFLHSHFQCSSHWASS